MFNWLSGTIRQVQAFQDIRWIEREVERLFSGNVEDVEAKAEVANQTALKDQRIEEAASLYLKSLSASTQSRNRTISIACEEYEKVQRQRQRISSLKAKLLKAAKG